MADAKPVPAIPAPKVPSVWDTLDVQIAHNGRAITLPAEPSNMPLGKAIEALVRKQADEEQAFSVHERFDAFPTDAAVAFVRAMTKLYGWASPQTQIIETFFGTKKIPPTMLSVKTGPDLADVVQCPLGEFKLPGCEAPITTLIHPEAGFIVYGEIKKKDRHIVLELATETRNILRENSIYRGKPIRLSVSQDGILNTMSPPEFMDVRDIRESHLLFDELVMEQINTNMLVPLKNTQACKDNGIPLKRGILLEGPFGTGKSLTARLTAHVAQENGWTFVLLDKVQGLHAALEFANRYAPAVVFAEDIDRIIEERDDGANDLINTIDGVISKRSEIMVVLTTNFIEKINPVILRPGRLDAVISLRAPGAETVEKLIRHYADKLLAPEESLTKAGKELAGQIPASIRECVERAKLGMIGRQANTLSEKDIVVAAVSMKAHLKLLEPKAKAATHAETLAGSLRDVVTGAIDQKLNGHGVLLNDIQDSLN